MLENNIEYISEKYSKDDYVNLHLDINSNNDTWKIAIDIFTSRFNERYFNPIKKLLKCPRKNGFAIMALNCLLIDTFYQFENGVNSTSIHNKEKYVSFLLNNLSSIIASEDIAIKFYKSIRCGILHSAQTKDGSTLCYKSNDAIEYRNNHNSINVNVCKFSDEMLIYFNNYISRLNSGYLNTRKNFIKKMNYIFS